VLITVERSSASQCSSNLVLCSQECTTLVARMEYLAVEIMCPAPACSSKRARTCESNPTMQSAHPHNCTLGWLIIIKYRSSHPSGTVTFLPDVNDWPHLDACRNFAPDPFACRVAAPPKAVTRGPPVGNGRVRAASKGSERTTTLRHSNTTESCHPQQIKRAFLICSMLKWPSKQALEGRWKTFEPSEHYKQICIAHW
jgi:hypothetical protein